MDKRVVTAKLESMRRCLARVELKCPKSAQQLKDDVDLQDILSVNLERAVQIAVDLAVHALAARNVTAPKTMAEAFLVLQSLGLLSHPCALHMSKAVGFRNIAVHEYESIDWDIVFAIATRHLDDFRKFAAEILAIS